MFRVRFVFVLAEISTTSFSDTAASSLTRSPKVFATPLLVWSLSGSERARPPTLVLVLVLVLVMLSVPASLKMDLTHHHLLVLLRLVRLSFVVATSVRGE